MDNQSRREREPFPPGGGLLRKAVKSVIRLTKRNGDTFLVNYLQIECIETIPETKIVMMNRDYYLVKESADEIIDKISQYSAKVQDIHRELSIIDMR